MRPRIITLLPIALSLASFASAHHDVRTSITPAPPILLISPLQNPLQQTNEAREDVGTLSSRGLGDEFALERREVSEDIATRDLLDELEGRLARRRGPKRRFYCERKLYQSLKGWYTCDFGCDSKREPSYYVNRRIRILVTRFEEEIGLKYLCGMHLNDSKTECGSRRDRQENIGIAGRREKGEWNLFDALGRCGGYSYARTACLGLVIERWTALDVLWCGSCFEGGVDPVEGGSRCEGSLESASLTCVVMISGRVGVGAVLDVYLFPRMMLLLSEWGGLCGLKAHGRGGGDKRTKDMALILETASYERPTEVWLRKERLPSDVPLAFYFLFWKVRAGTLWLALALIKGNVHVALYPGNVDVNAHVVALTIDYNKIVKPNCFDSAQSTRTLALCTKRDVDKYPPNSIPAEIDRPFYPGLHPLIHSPNHSPNAIFIDITPQATENQLLGLRMNTTNTVQTRSQASVPRQEIRERAPTPAELIARLNQRNQTASLSTKIEYDEYSDLFRRAWRHIPSFKSLNEGTKDDTEDEEMQALLNSFNLYCHTETEEMQVLLNRFRYCRI
ncbi:hypothetical protein DFP72DRAFT_856622 [Ephemerocybe angulata]|uniref:Uncharacterized protein n=1 Tax=Ephemerocybe angulata TaxID=980116 RepID=A0A8H6HGA4_9AGAR|nr:hypothetical protein DFP72DRAFT_856622 [Tulosesus angulatus]